MSQTTQGQVSGDREQVLRAIRSAMSQPTDPHVRHAPLEPDRTTYAAGLPPVAEDVESKLAAFAARCEALKTTLIVVDTPEAAAAKVQQILAAEPAGGVAYQREPLASSIVDHLDPSRERVCVDDGFDARRVEACAVGISNCFALVAQTGSVLVTAESTGGRSLSVLPPHHIVVTSIDRLLPTLPAAFAAFREQGGDTSMLSLISGPSRTGDIERILVLGAHGPKRLTIILVR